MTITWYGQSCFRLEAREGVVAIDPFDKTIGLAPPRFHADLLLVTHAHPDHANAAAIPARSRGETAIPAGQGRGSENQWLITGPGEYELSGLAIQGIPTFHDPKGGHERGLNTAFRMAIASEGIVLAHLGDFGEEAMRAETLEALGDVDILMIPVGGTYTIDGQTAAKVVRQIEPRMVIPMHYALPGLSIKLAPVESFLNAYGAPPADRSARLTKLVIRKRDVPEDATRVVVLAASSA